MNFKVIKKSLKILAWAFLFILLLLGLAGLSLTFPSVQTWLTGRITSHLSNELNTTITIKNVDFRLFDHLVLKGILFEDQKKDTLLYCDRLDVSLLKLNTDSNKFDLGDIILERPDFYLKRFPGKDEGMNLDFIIDYFSSSDTSGPHRTTTITASSLQLVDARFRYKDQRDSVSTTQINFEDLELRRLNGNFSDVEVVDDSVRVRINDLSFLEKSGFRLVNMNTTAILSPTGLWCDALYINTPFTRIESRLKFITESYDDYNDFIEKVYMEGEFGFSEVSSVDLAYFADELRGMNRSVTIDGKVRGTVNNLKGKNIEFSYGKNTNFKGDISLTGLPSIEETFIHLKINELISTKEDIETIPMYPFDTPGTIEVPSNVSMLGKIKFKGDFTGFINDFVAYGSFRTDLGQLSSDIALTQDTATGMIRYKGNLKTFAFDIGRFYRVPETVGKLTMDVSVDGKSFILDKMDLTVDGLVNSLTVKGYDYKNITAKGRLLKKIFEGSVSITDPNMTFSFDGNVDLTQKLPLLDFTADIKKANLTATHLLEGKENAEISSTVIFKIRGNNIDNLNGNIAALNTKYIQGDKSISIAEFDLVAAESRNQKTLQLWSDVADAEIKGRFNSEQIVSSFIDLLRNYLPSLYKEDKKQKHIAAVEDFTFSVRAKKTDEITAMFYPEVDLNSELKVSGTYSSVNRSFSLYVDNSESIVHGLGVRDLSVMATGRGNELNLVTGIGQLALSDTLDMQNISIGSRATNDSIHFSVGWKNNDRHVNEGDLRGTVDFANSMPVKLRLYNSSVTMHDSVWNITSAGKILFDSTFVYVPGVTIHSGNQTLQVNGTLDRKTETPLKFTFTNFILANINPLLNPSGVSLYGTIQGTAALQYQKELLTFTSDLGFTDFTFNNERLGNGTVKANWDPVADAIVMDGKFLRGALPTFAFEGSYIPVSDKQNFDIKMTLQKTQLKLVQPYIKDLASNVSGFASGDLYLKGTVEKPELTGTLNLQKVGFKIDYLNTSYTFSNTVTVNKGSFDFGNMHLFDETGNEAIVNGSVKHNNFSNITFDVTINAKNFLCLNTEQKDNDLYFGRAVTTGKIRVAGDTDNIVMDIQARTEKGTQFNIPLESATDVSESNFINFKSRDTVSISKTKVADVNLSGIQMNFDLEVTPDAEVQMIFDPKVGDIIKGRGNGNLKLEINTLGVFRIFGDYVIREGDYLFTLQNVINKRFKVDQGGTITWSGDPYDAEINLNAVYKVRTSLANLFPKDTSAAHKKRIPIDCNLKMTDKLMNPTIRFDISVPPTVDESIRSDIRNRINPENEQELNKQIFSLLILGTFYNPEQGFANNDSQFGASVGANSTELLSNQLSNWLSSSIKAVDVGVKYHGKDVELNLSKQLFNERLSIDGNVGVANAEKSSNVIGDAIIEYKVSKDGKLRVNAFTQTNDYSTNLSGTTNKNGVGLSYREEFDTMGELFRRYREKFRKKKKADTEQKPAAVSE